MTPELKSAVAAELLRLELAVNQMELGELSYLFKKREDIEWVDAAPDLINFNQRLIFLLEKVLEDKPDDPGGPKLRGKAEKLRKLSGLGCL